MNSTNLALGQLFLVGFSGQAVTEDHPLVATITRSDLGGVILFDRTLQGDRQNIVSPDQLRRLTASLQRYAATPLLVAVDQEGGKVCRLKEEDGFAGSLPAQRFGDLDDPAATGRAAESMAMELSDCGINLNLAPVVDLDLNPANPIIGRYQRCYGSEPAQVVRHAAAFIDAHHRNGVACCLKHFPGHGSAAGDSHLGFVDTTDQWQPDELEPYRQLCAAGLADSVMTAHVVNRQLDPSGLPATLSAPVLEDLLRSQIGFDGVTFSDDLQMRAISDQWSYEEAVQRALLAGVDMLIVCNVLAQMEDPVERGIRAVRDLLAQGRIGEERLRASLQRIATLKRKIQGEIPWTKARPTT